MSLAVMALVWQMDPKLLTSVQRLVLLALADHADEHGVCWPLIDDLADKVGLSAGNLRKHLTALEDAGWFERSRAANWKGRYSYTMDLDVIGRARKSARSYPKQPRIVDEEPDRKPQPAARARKSARSDGHKSSTDGANIDHDTRLERAALRGHIQTVNLEEEVSPNGDTSRHRRNERWDALVDILGEPSPKQRSLYGRIVSRARSPDDIRDRANVYVRAFSVALTPPALDKHWEWLGSQAARLAATTPEERKKAMADEATRRKLREALDG